MPVGAAVRFCRFRSSVNVFEASFHSETKILAERFFHILCKIAAARREPGDGVFSQFLNFLNWSALPSKFLSHAHRGR